MPKKTRPLRTRFSVGCIRCLSMGGLVPDGVFAPYRRTRRRFGGGWTGPRRNSVRARPTSRRRTIPGGDRSSPTRPGPRSDEGRAPGLKLLSLRSLRPRPTPARRRRVADRRPGTAKRGHFNFALTGRPECLWITFRFGRLKNEGGDPSRSPTFETRRKVCMSTATPGTGQSYPSLTSARNPTPLRRLLQCRTGGHYE